MSFLTHGKFLLSDKQLKSLKHELKASRKKAYAQGTAKNLRIQWESFLLFCLYFGLKYLPTSTETLSLYTQFLSRTFKSTHSIKNYVSGVKSMHYLLGYPVEHINDFLINLGLKGIARLNPHCVRQAAPVTPEILLKIASVLNLSKTSDKVFWCFFRFAFFLFARKSNLVPTTKDDVKNKKYLMQKDVSVEKDMLLVSFRYSKTIQFGERNLVTPLVKIQDSILCPVKAYQNMCSSSQVQPEDPLFSLPNKGCIWYSQFQAKLKQLIRIIGLNADNFSTHSFRRAGSSCAFRAGVPADLIQLHGDWKSDAYKKYLVLTIDDKIRVAERMRKYILTHEG